MNKWNSMNYGVFLNTMIRECTSLLFDLRGDYNVSAFWVAQDRDDLSLQALELTVPDCAIKIHVRFTATPEWFQLDCGPVSERAPYTRYGADVIQDAMTEMSNWIRDCFDEPESVDPSLLFKLTETNGLKLLWPVEGFENDPKHTQSLDAPDTAMPAMVH